MQNKLTIRLSDYTQALRNASSSRKSPLAFMFQKNRLHDSVFTERNIPKYLTSRF